MTRLRVWRRLHHILARWRADDRLPHGACKTCFTVPGLKDGRYQIFERLEVAGEEILIPRMIPNPSPAMVNESPEPEIDDETGERIWYIGDQGHVGPTDEAPLSTIKLKRIQMRHMPSIMSIKGVHRLGIGATGFVVGLDPVHAENADQIPLSLDNVPVTVELAARLQAAAHHTVEFCPVPVGAGFGVKVYPLSGNRWGVYSGTIGPHVVRNADDVGTCCPALVPHRWSCREGVPTQLESHAGNPCHLSAVWTMDFR